MELSVASVCDRGLSAKRPVNEDRALVLSDRGLFVVCDGVGGHNSGEVASQLAVDTIEEAFERPNGGDVAELLERAVQYANRDIYETAISRPEYDGMATTIALLYLDREAHRAVVGHAGDSRVYRFDGRLYRETYDHTDLDDAVRAGRLTRADAIAQGKQNTINRALGVEHDVQAEFKTIDYADGDAFLLCSDGVTRHIEDAELEELFARGLEAKSMCEEIRSRCYSRGAEDNLTAVVVHTGPVRPRPATRHAAVDRGNEQRIRVSFGAEPAEPPVASRRESNARGPSRKPFLFALLAIALAVGAFWLGRASIGVWPRTPPPPVVPVTSGREALERNDLITARATFAQLVAQEPERAEYQYWLARALDRQGSVEEAIQRYERAIALDPQLGDAYVFLAASYERAGKRDLALQTLKKYGEIGKK
jgi:serine/threonine protein phosphatase PrpC